MESIQNKCYCPYGVTRKFGQGHHRALTSAQFHYLSLLARRHRCTMAPQFARDLPAVPGRRVSRQTVYSRLAETDFYARRSFCCVPLTVSRERRDIVELKTSVSSTPQE
ncbi:hypothetical protein TNCV_4923811 [Trichonephila clavipes]|nr:hypothetical protein TNCV_4923811 [Trichonephila clavipes]